MKNEPRRMPSLISIMRTGDFQSLHDRFQNHLREVREVFGELNSRLKKVQERMDDMQPAMERLSQSVERNRQQGDSLVALINGLAEQIRNASNDPAAINKIADDLDQKSQRWADVVAANTPQSGGSGGGSSGGGGEQPT